MNIWKTFGASVRGPKHIRDGKPNQDAWTAFHRMWGDGIIVCDGVGEKVFPEFGSNAACRAVACTAFACRHKTEIELTFISEQIKNKWLSFIAPLEPRECSTTCLYAFRLTDGIIRIGMLGDGLIAILRDDGTVQSFTENKTDGFSNIVSTTLSENISGKEWRFLTLPEKQCRAILLCTDGVSDDLVDIDKFIQGFAAHTVNLACVSASRYTRIMLEKWPTPKHSDDKTIACLFWENVENE